MIKSTLEKAVSLAREVGYVFLATADTKGTPHMSIVQPSGIDEKQRLQLTGWICQYTLMNLKTNGRVSVLIWEQRADVGYQLIGRSEEIKEITVLDGIAPKADKEHPIPQFERRITIRIEKIFGFEQKPHIDAEV